MLEDEIVQDVLYTYDGELPEHLVDTKYTLHRDLPKGVECGFSKEKFASSLTLYLKLRVNANFLVAVELQADISDLKKDKIFKKEVSMKSKLTRYIIDYDFVARHQDLDRDSIICSLSLTSKNGEKLRNVKTTAKSIKFSVTDKNENETVLLGSLVSRAEKGSHIPESDFGHAPLFPDRKRGSDELESEGEDEAEVEVEIDNDDGDDEDYDGGRSAKSRRKFARRAW